MKDQLMSDEEIVKKVSELVSIVTKVEGGIDDIELQDVVDSRDRVIGILPRGVIWENGLQGFTRVVNIFVVNEEGQLLLPVRSMSKKYLPGGYDYSCGENLLAGENYLMATERGLNEELGLIKGSYEIEEKGTFNPDHEKGLFCFGKVFVAKIDSLKEKIKINPLEVDKVEWFNIEDVRDMVKRQKSKFKRDYETLFEMCFPDN